MTTSDRAGAGGLSALLAPSPHRPLDTAAGHVEVYRGQRYELLREEPYTRRDGMATSILIWASRCWRCGQPFECTTSSDPAQFKPARRCEECRKRGRWRSAARVIENASPPAQPGQREFAPIDVYDGRGR